MTEVILNREQTELADEWPKVINISEEHADCCQEVTDMLAEFEPMCDGHFATMKTLKRQIDL